MTIACVAVTYVAVGYVAVDHVAHMAVANGAIASLAHIGQIRYHINTSLLLTPSLIMTPRTCKMPSLVHSLLRVNSDELMTFVTVVARVLVLRILV